MKRGDRPHEQTRNSGKPPGKHGQEGPGGPGKHRQHEARGVHGITMEAEMHPENGLGRRFAEGYSVELEWRNEDPAPQVIRTDGPNTFAVPVRVRKLTFSEYEETDSAMPLSERAASHELTLGVLTDDEDDQLAELLLQQYTAHTVENGNVTNVEEVATLVTKLNELCGGEHMAMFHIGTQLARFQGNEPHRLAMSIMEKAKDMATENGG